MKDYTNFTFHMYTEDIFGKGTESQVGDLVKKYGGTKVLLVYGGGSIKKSGLYDRVIASLDKAGIKHVDLGGVQANPVRFLPLQHQRNSFLACHTKGSSQTLSRFVAVNDFTPNQPINQ